MKTIESNFATEKKYEFTGKEVGPDFGELRSDLSFMFDFIYTPGSMLRYHKNDMKEHPEKKGTLDDYLNKGTAYFAEGFRLLIYGAVAFTFSPILSLGLLGTGVFSRFVNKYFEKEGKK